MSAPVLYRHTICVSNDGEGTSGKLIFTDLLLGETVVSYAVSCRDSERFVTVTMCMCDAQTMHVRPGSQYTLESIPVALVLRISTQVQT